MKRYCLLGALVICVTVFSILGCRSQQPVALFVNGVGPVDMPAWLTNGQAVAPIEPLAATLGYVAQWQEGNLCLELGQGLQSARQLLDQIRSDREAALVAEVLMRQQEVPTIIGSSEFVATITRSLELLKKDMETYRNVCRYVRTIILDEHTTGCTANIDPPTGTVRVSMAEFRARAGTGQRPALYALTLAHEAVHAQVYRAALPLTLEDEQLLAFLVEYRLIDRLGMGQEYRDWLLEEMRENAPF